jgi:hypothetical protein
MMRGGRVRMCVVATRMEACGMQCSCPWQQPCPAVLCVVSRLSNAF